MVENVNAFLELLSIYKQASASKPPLTSIFGFPKHLLLNPPFTGTVFHGTCIYGAIFHGTCIYGACIYGACIYGTYIYGAIFYGACIYGTCIKEPRSHDSSFLPARRHVIDIE